jgi:hypothetical protein
MEDQKRSKSGSRKANSKKRMQMVTWGTSKSRLDGAKAFSSIRDTLQGIAKTGQSAYKDVYRRAKVISFNDLEVD